MSNTIIDTEIKLKLHLTLFKKTAMKQGTNPFSVYPAFGHYYQNNLEKYNLPKETVYNMACEILIP